MSTGLDTIIIDENLVWDETLGSKKEEFLVTINASIINLLIENRELFSTVDPWNLILVNFLNNR